MPTLNAIRDPTRSLRRWMYSAKNVFPVPLSPYRITGVAAGAKACAREIASIIGGARAMGSFDDGRERRSGSKKDVVTSRTLRRHKISRGLIPALRPSDLDPLGMMRQGFP